MLSHLNGVWPILNLWLIVWLFLLYFLSKCMYIDDRIELKASKINQTVLGKVLDYGFLLYAFVEVHVHIIGKRWLGLETQACKKPSMWYSP